MPETDLSFLTPEFFSLPQIYPGNIGTFRYRFQRTGKLQDGSIQAWVYENICFEQAKTVETETFPWTPEGVEALRAWLSQKLAERGAEPYRLPYPPAKAGEQG